MPSEVKEKATSVPLLKIVGRRHILVHGYFEIDTEVVWNVVDRDLPELKREILNILRNLESGGKEYLIFLLPNRSIPKLTPPRSCTVRGTVPEIPGPGVFAA